jgi:bacillithiol system protein YtxJ
MKIVPLHDMAEWHLLREKATHVDGVIIFKTSPTCTLSQGALQRFEQWAEKLDEQCKLLLFKVDVKSDRLLSQLIAEEVHVKHESPQVIWLKSDFSVKWHQSHSAITEAALQAHL